MGAIYRARCKANGKWYIGQTKHDSWEKRYAFVKYRSKIKERSYRKLQLFERALNKYQLSGFEFQNLFTDVLDDRIDALERFAIQYHDSADPEFGYNVESGGRRGKSCLKASAEASSIRNGIFARWYHKEHGVIYSNAKKLSVTYKIGQAALNNVRLGDQRFYRGWVCLDAPVHSGPNQRAYVWGHPVHGEFIGTTSALKIRFPEQNLYAPHLSGVVTGKFKYHKQWRFVRAPVLEEEIAARIWWADHCPPSSFAKAA